MKREEAIKLLQVTRLMLMDGANQPISDLYYALDMAIEALEQTEPQTITMVKNHGRKQALEMIDLYHKFKTEPTISKMEQVDEPQTCYTCEYEWRDGTDEPCVYCYGGSKYKPKDEPQKHCHRPSDVACHPENGDIWCRGCDYWYANEPQAERSSE